MTDHSARADESIDDPVPLRGDACDTHGEYNNFSGRCWACIPAGELLRWPGVDRG